MTIGAVVHPHLNSMETVILSSMVESLLKNLITLLLDEDIREIQSGGEHKIIMAKQELQELEKHISYASFIVAGGVSDSGRFSRWISKAQLDAFCLEDRIAMYAMQGLEYPSYALKAIIGKFSIEKLTNNIKDHIQNMPDDLKSSDIMAKLSDIPPFIQKSYTLPAAGEILGAKKTADEVKEFLRGGHQVLFIISGQGSGKTTLMKHVYNSSHIEFTRRLHSWVNVAETKGLVGILKKVLEFEGSTMDPDAIDELEIMKTIHDKFKDKDYLIVLDDVQDTCVLYSLMHVLNKLKGKIICLTRTDIHEEHVTIRISPLVWHDARMLLMRAAFPGYKTTASDDGFRNAVMWRRLSRPSWILRLEDLDKMEETLKDMLSQCQGNPWNICTVGAVLEDNPFEKWIEIKGRINRTLIHDNISSSNRDPPIKLEDANLSPKVRLVFLYCLAFPERSEIPGTSAIPKRKLIRLWTAEGFLHDSGQNQEQEAEGLLDELVKTKLLVVNKRGINGEVLKYSVNEHIRPLALKMSEYQKFCRFVTKQDEEESPPSTRTENSQNHASSSCLNILPRARRTRAGLSIRYSMLAVHGHGGLKLASAALDKDVRLRSLLYFETDKTEPPKFELSFRHKCTLLRTLKLQGTNLDRLPSNIGCLVCLRYLGLRRTKLENLPPSVQRLKHLMCLDIRDTNITSVDDVSTFTEMRHLLLTDSFCDKKSVVIQKGLRFLIYLQTLSGARHSGQDQPFEQNLLSLKLLRKLSIKKVSSAASKDICAAISKMEFLRSLSITSDGNQFDLKFLEIGRNLYKLKLGGDMGALCDRRLSMMQSITYLYLWHSNLQADPLLKLQGLPRLLLLSLYNAYTGQKMSCENGYMKLKKLSIISMENLTSCTFGEGTMKNLEDLMFTKCSKLNSSPQGLEHILSLKRVYLSEMHRDFGKSVKASTKGVQIHEINMYFHKSSRAATEGSQTKTDKAATPPATGGEGTETNAISDIATPPRDAKDTKVSPSKLMADAQKSYKHSKQPASPPLISKKGKEVLSIEKDIQDDSDEDSDSQTGGAGYEAGQSILTQNMGQITEIDLTVEKANNALVRFRENPTIYHLPNFVQSYPGAVQNEPWIADRSTSDIYASGVKTLHMDEIETSVCYEDNVSDLRHQTECEIEELTTQKVVTSTTSSNEERNSEGSQKPEPESVTPPTTEGEGSTQSMVIDPTTPLRGAKGKTQDSKYGDNEDREEAGQTSSMTKTCQSSEQTKEQLTKYQSSDVGALVPRLQESEVHEYDNAAKNASTAHAIQSSNSTPSTKQESS